MPSHLSSIGFQVATREEFASLAQRVHPHTDSFPVRGGSYRRWAGNGAELWLQIDKRGGITGMNPHFAGESRNRAGVVERIRRPNDSPLDGSFYAWASPDAADPLQGAYPYVFDLPDAAACSSLLLPRIVEVQVAAFAHEVEYFASEETFSRSHESAGIRFGSRFFIPSGTFRPEGAADSSPIAEAMFSGQVIRSARRTNPLSGLPFDWGLVDTYGGQYDVVLDPALLGEVPAVGGFLKGTFWLSGRLTSPPPKESNWLGRLIGKG